MLRRISFAASVTAMLLGAARADAATFDAATGTLRLEQGLLLSQSFDDIDALGPARVFASSHAQGYTTFTDTTESIDATHFANGAPEGGRALRIAGDRAVLLGDAASLAPLAKGRVEVRLFARADGALPQMRVVYARSSFDAQALGYPNAQVTAIRTGRVTSDGWIELSTGPIDGTVYGSTISGILLVAEREAPGAASFLVDALEVTKVADAPLSGADCRIATEAATCHKGAVCMESKCIDSAIAYGALPPLEAREDAVSRQAMLLTRFQNDRHATTNALAGFAKEMPPIAESATTPEEFFRPFLASAGRARGAHSAPSMPEPYSRLASGGTRILRYRGSELNACFGIVDKDLLGGGRGFAVFATASPSPLAVGDVVDAIDGEPVDTWLARLTAEHELLAADPDSDAPIQAEALNGLVLRFGHDLSVRRCTGAGACQTIAIDLPTVRAALADLKPLVCGPRFQLAVTPPVGADPNAYDAAILGTAADGTIAIHTNGEPVTDNAAWVATVTEAFANAHDRLLVDKRRGDGGGGDALGAWAKNLRRPSDIGLFFVNRFDHAAIDGPAGFLDTFFGKCSGKSTSGSCAIGYFETYAPASGALPTKTAWLTTIDGSASDMSTFFAKGATGVRVFGPNRTMGLFGSLGIMPGVLPGWAGGSVQLGDIREGTSNAERVTGAWHSGHGVEMDEIVVQKQSDLIAGRDTMLDRAHAWLAEP